MLVRLRDLHNTTYIQFYLLKGLDDGFTPVADMELCLGQ